VKRPYHKRGKEASLIVIGSVAIDISAIIWTDIEVTSFIARDGGKIKIGANTFINNGVWIRSALLVSIGNDCNIGPRVMIMDNDAHEIEGKHIPGGEMESVIIEDNVWIGAGAIILKGVHIGKNSIVGAGSVVTTHISQNMIVAGNPVRSIRK